MPLTNNRFYLTLSILGRGLVALVVAAGFSLFADEARAQTTRRLALVVGQDTGLATDVELKYAEKDADEMAGVLKELGGFDNIELLMGPSSQELLESLEVTRQKIARYKAKGENVFFVFFYSGHGDDRALHLGGSVFPSDDLVDRIEDIGADLRVAIIDACQSGSMVRDKGLIGKGPLNIQLHDDTKVRGQAILASTSQGEAAQESDALGGSFFTSYLITGLRGAADRNKDGIVTLIEAHSYAFDRTISGTAVSSQGMQHPTYDMDLKGKQEVVLTWPERGSSVLRFSAATPGRFLVIDQASKRVVAEIDTGPGTPNKLRLPEGIYRVKKRAPTGLLHASVRLHSGSDVTLNETSMLVTPYVQPANKGASVGPTDDESFIVRRPWTWAASAAAVATLGTGTTFMILAARDYRRAEDLAAEGQNDASISTSDVARYDERRVARRNIGAVLLGVGGAFAATAATLFVLEGRHAEQNGEDKKTGKRSLWFTPTVGEGGAAVTLGGRF